MAEEYNTFLKSPEELDFDLETNSRTGNSDISRNRPKDDYIFLNEIIENSIEENITRDEHIDSDRLYPSQE